MGGLMSDLRGLTFVPVKGRHVISNDAGKATTFRAYDMHARVAFRVRPVHAAPGWLLWRKH